MPISGSSTPQPSGIPQRGGVFKFPSSKSQEPYGVDNKLPLPKVTLPDVRITYDLGVSNRSQKEHPDYMLSKKLKRGTHCCF